jgi:hypothetical protein
MNMVHTKFFLIITSLVISVAPAFAQKDSKGGKSVVTYVSPTAKVSKFYSKEELEKMGKLELTQIYMERISVVTELSPYLALHTKPGASLEEMGIPRTGENLEHLEKEVKNKEAYLKSVKDTLDDIIPYADKQNIIWAIMFYDEMIQKIEQQNQQK